MIESNDQHASLGTRIRNPMLAAAFGAWCRWTRLRRVLRGLGRPRLGMVDHITIPVHDLDVARRFYCDVLGAAHLLTVDDAVLTRFGRPPADDGGDGVHHVSLLFGGGTRVDLFLQRHGQPAPLQGHPHYAFRVPARHMLRWKQQLHARGVATEGPLQLGFPGQASLYFNDPSGNHLELVCLGFTRPLPIRAPDLGRLVRVTAVSGAAP